MRLCLAHVGALCLTLLTYSLVVPLFDIVYGQVPLWSGCKAGVALARHRGNVYAAAFARSRLPIGYRDLPDRWSERVKDMFSVVFPLHF